MFSWVNVVGLGGATQKSHLCSNGSCFTRDSLLMSEVFAVKLLCRQKSNEFSAGLWRTTKCGGV